MARCFVSKSISGSFSCHYAPCFVDFSKFCFNWRDSRNIALVRSESWVWTSKSSSLANHYQNIRVPPSIIRSANYSYLEPASCVAELVTIYRCPIWDCEGLLGRNWLCCLVILNYKSSSKTLKYHFTYDKYLLNFGRKK